MSDLHIDIETYSKADLKKVGVYKYAEHETTEVMLFAWAFDNGPVSCVDLTRGEGIPPHVLDAMVDPSVTKWAHNAQFEITLIERCLGIKLIIEQWRCTMVLAYSLSLPGGLGKLCGVLGIGEDKAKMSAGSRLIRKFCMPNKVARKNVFVRHMPTDQPDDWDRFILYCEQDVEAEREVHRILSKWEMPEHEWSNWHLDQHINRTGLPIDVPMVDTAIRLAHAAAADVKGEIEALTGCNPNSTTQMLDWYNAKGCDIANVQKGTLRDLLDQPHLDDEVRYITEQRLESNMASVKKFDALQRSVLNDNRVKGSLQFAGARRTWRWSGRIFQPQNIARGNLKPHQYDTALAFLRDADPDLIGWAYGGVNSLLTSLVRPAVAAPEGKKLVVCDLASIETIMLAWACESQYMLDLFRNGLDPYIDYATHLLGIPYDQITKAQRAFAKPPTLGCGYMLAKYGLIAYAKGYGVHMTEEEAARAVKVYRAAYPDVVKFWDEIDAACRYVIRHRDTMGQNVGPFHVYYDAPFMKIVLPSGRCLSYLQPRVQDWPAPWDRAQLIKSITYMGYDKNGRWTRISTHPGKLTENIVQAIARDVLAHGLMKASKLDLEIVLHVHDEIGALADQHDATALGRLSQAMTDRPPWCADAPISAAGYESQYYYKD